MAHAIRMTEAETQKANTKPNTAKNDTCCLLFESTRDFVRDVVPLNATDTFVNFPVILRLNFHIFLRIAQFNQFYQNLLTTFDRQKD